MHHLLSLINRTTFREWTPARFSGTPAALYPDQIRIYSNGSSSAFLHLSKGRVSDIGVAKEVYSERKPLGNLWERIQTTLKSGTAVLYVGGVDNVRSVVTSGKEITNVSSPDGSTYAQCQYPLSKDQSLRCGTKIPPDLYSQFQTCAAARVPVDVVDELSATLGAIESIAKFPTDKTPSAAIVIYEHYIYGALYRDGQLIDVSDLSLRSGSGFDKPRYDSIPEMVQMMLAPHGLEATALTDVLIYDATSLSSDPAWGGTLKRMIEREYKTAKLHHRLPTEIERLEQDVATAVDFRSATQFPLPLMAFWPAAS